MERVAAIYDIHGNLPALEAVLEDVRRAGVELIVVGGDVLPGPMPRESLACLFDLDLPIQFIRGNGDRIVLEEHSGVEVAGLPEAIRATVRWNAEQLSPDDVSRISAWPETLRVDVRGLGDVLFCHATPRNDTEVFTRLTPEDRLLPIFEPPGASVVVCGHTHMQFDRMIGRARVVNAGSVGMPYGDPAAYWLLLGPGVELRRTSYDLERAAERVRATSYPQAGEFADNDLLHPRSEREMVELFGTVELK
jgi:predicted phosphodiesterase